MTKENINLEELKQVFFEILSINESTANICIRDCETTIKEG